MEAFFDLPFIFVATVFLALVFDYVNGFNDAANAIATVVATKVMAPGPAVLMSAAFNFLGPIIVGVSVAKAIGTGTVSTGCMENGGVLLVLAGLIGASFWGLLTWWWGIPISCSHALIGGLVGAALAVDMSVGSVVWITHGPEGWFDKPKGVLLIMVFMVIAPFLGMIGSALLAFANERAFAKKDARKANWWYRKLQLDSAAFYSFTHGANDAQKVMGVITMILVAATAGNTDVAGKLGISLADPAPPTWVVVACAAAIGLGTASGGWRVVKTMASKITKLHPFEGFCAETGSAIVLLGTAHFGIPVSTTHVISGSIMGVGATKSLRRVRWGTARRIMLAWIITIPVTAIVSFLVFFLLSKLPIFANYVQ